MWIHPLFKKVPNKCIISMCLGSLLKYTVTSCFRKWLCYKRFKKVTIYHEWFWRVAAGIWESTERQTNFWDLLAVSKCSKHPYGLGCACVCVTFGCTCEAHQAFTLVVVLLIDAGGVVLTGSWRALVDVNFAVVALKPWHAEAVILCHSVHTDSSILTGHWFTLIDIFLTGVPLKPWCTLAFKALWLQYTSPLVLAGFIDAVSHMRLAILSSVPNRTPAEVSVQLVYAQRARLCARVALTFIHLLCAVISYESVRADAVVICGAGDAGAVFAWSKWAGIIELITVFAHVSDPVSSTDAGVVIHGVHAGSSVLTGSRQTFVWCGWAKDSWKIEEKGKLRSFHTCSETMVLYPA